MFFTVLSNVSVILAYILCGFLIVKSKKGSADHAKTFSAILAYVLSPCMIIDSFLKIEPTRETLVKTALFFLFSLIVQILFLGLLYLVFGKKFEDAKYRIATVSSTLGNVGFLGLPVVTTIFKDQPIVACYSCAYVFSMNLLVFTVGRALITNDKKQASIKSAILNPTTISILIALPLLLFQVKAPTALAAPLGVLSKATTPVCMFVLGFRLASVKNLKDLFKRPFVYLSCFLKLVVFPFFAFLCVYFLPFLDETFKFSLFILSGMPSGAIILSISELYGTDSDLCANVLFLSTIFCVLTIPILALLV